MTSPGIYDTDSSTEAIEVDDRVVLMQKISDMEQVQSRLLQDRDNLDKKAAGLSAQIKQARNELAKRMGWESNNKPAAAAANLSEFYGDAR